MQESTVKILNQINQTFYAEIAPFWNNSSDYAWDGWKKLDLPIKLKTRALRPLKILDIGCGNARFYTFLKSYFSDRVQYFGIDSSSFLLGVASQNYSAQFITNFNQIDNLVNQQKVGIFLLKKDLLQLDFSQILSKFDLVVLFGVMHHIPSYLLRQKILVQASNLVDLNSYLTWTSWQFLNLSRLKKRIVDLDSILGMNLCKSWNLDKADLEVGDYILDWVKIKLYYRYSHFFSDQEIKDLNRATGLNWLEDFCCDGKEQNRNRYLMLKNR